MIGLIVLVWVGFVACAGLLLSARMVKSSFQKRMIAALSPTEDEIDVPEEETRDEEMGRNVVARLLTPVLKKMGAAMKRRGKGGSGGNQVKELLEQAGNPMGMNVPEFMALKLFTIIFFGGLGFVSSFFAVPFILNFAGVPGDPQLNLMGIALWVVVFAFLGYSGPTFWLRRTINKRTKTIRRQMADVVDLIVLAVEAGLGFDQAVGQACEKTKGPLSDELRRVLEEVNVGRSQGEAFRDMATRVRMPELTLLVAAIDQATRMGTSIGAALRLQSVEIRERRMAWVKEQAGKLPVKMMIPLVFFIFPALFVVILGPAAVQMQVMQAKGELNF